MKIKREKKKKTQKAFGKGRRRRSSKRFKDCKGCKCCSNANQGLAFIDSSSLVKRTIRRVITFRKT